MEATAELGTLIIMLPTKSSQAPVDGAIYHVFDFGLKSWLILNISQTLPISLAAGERQEIASTT